MMNQLNKQLSGTPLRTAGVTAHVARTSVRVSAAARKPNWQLDSKKRLWEIGSELWYPGATPPAHLDASLPGDRGFDPLRLGEKFTIGEGDEAANGLPWLVEGELYNGRVAMLATVGVLAAEFTGNGPWYTAVQRTDFVLPYWPLVTAVHIAYGTFEYSRWQNFRNKGETGLVVAPFDPLKITNDYRRQSEVRNARLAMLAQLGFWTQAWATGKAPLENLQEHLADPLNHNILTSQKGQQVAAWLLSAGLALLFLEAGNTAEREGGGGKDETSAA